jgi:hypothetical protein
MTSIVSPHWIVIVTPHDNWRACRPLLFSTKTLAQEYINTRRFDDAYFDMFNVVENDASVDEENDDEGNDD